MCSVLRHKVMASLSAASWVAYRLAVASGTVVMVQPKPGVSATSRPSSVARSGVFLVVVAALPAGAGDAAGGGQRVGGLVQQRAEDLTGGAGQALAADHDFGDA